MELRNAELWNHYGNNGPRTNNVAEGWHSTLRHKFSCVHLGLAKFLTELQVMFDNVDVRLGELQRGEPAKPRVAAYIVNDARIDQAKQHIANFMNVYLFVPLPPGFPDANAWMDWEIWRYLAHQAHHIGVGN